MAPSVFFFFAGGCLGWKGVRAVMSATTKRDVEHQVCTKTCKRPQVPTKFKHRAKNAESQEGTKKRAPVKSKGKHLCQSGKISMAPSASPSVVNSSPSTLLILVRMFGPQLKSIYTSKHRSHRLLQNLPPPTYSIFWQSPTDAGTW